MPFARVSRVASVVLVSVALVSVGCRRERPVATYRTPEITPAVTLPPASAEAAATAPVPSATAVAGPTAAPAPAGLGSTEKQIIAKLGPPTSRQRQRGGDVQLRIGMCPRQYDPVRITVTLVKGKVIGIVSRSCPTGGASVEANTTEVKELFPPDADAGTAFTDDEGEPAMRYTSASLAKALPADQFLDCDDQPVAPGTFSTSITAERWSIVAGTCP